MTYTEEQIKEAFWRMFHKSGEWFFNYFEYPGLESCENTTDSVWQEFLEELTNEN